MFAIISALKSELEPILQKQHLMSKIKLGNGTLYIAEQVHLLRLGLGREQAAATLRAYLQEYKPAFVLNIGFAGSLQHKKIEPCAPFAINEIVNARDGQRIVLPVLPEFERQPKAHLLTVNEAVLKAEEKEQLYLKYGAALVDMEAYDLAIVSRTFGKPFYALKSVTDAADEKAAQTFKAHYKHCAQILFTTIQPVLSK
jgi:adenosylhomocysteine nucleosidase